MRATIRPIPVDPRPDARPGDVGRPGSSVGRLARDRAPHGFTLLELLVVIAILAILAAVATPQFSRLVATWRITSNLESIAMAVDFARAEAIGRNTLVQVCRSGNVQAATPACSAAVVGGIPANDWATGWIVYARPQGVVVAAPFDPATDELLRRYEPEGAGGGSVRSLVVTNTGESTLSFTGNGLRMGGDGNERLFFLDYRNPASATATASARCLRVSIVGKVRTGLPNAGGCDVS